MASSRSVQSGQVGTRWVRSPALASPAMAAVLASISAQNWPTLTSGTGLAAAAATAAAASAAATAGRAGTGPAADGDRGQQLHGVIVAVRAGRWLGRLAHRPCSLEGRPAGAASVLISWHGPSLRQIPAALIWQRGAGRRGGNGSGGAGCVNPGGGRRRGPGRCVGAAGRV